MRGGWQRIRLSSIAKKITDGSHNPPKGVANSAYLMLSSKNVFDDNFHYNSPRYLTEADFNQENKRTAIESGDVLLTIVGTIGRCAVVPPDAPNITLQRSVAVIRPKPEVVHPRFLMYSLMTRCAELNEQARGVAQKGIYLETLRELEIEHPSIPEQQRIVAILDQAFEAIATAKANAEKNLQNACELLQSSLAALFEGIETRKHLVEELAKQRKGAIRTGPFGSQLLHSEFVDDGIAVLGIDNAVENEFRWAKRRFITQKKYEQLVRYTVNPGDVIITIMGTCGRCAIVPEDIPTAINTKHLCCITLDQKKCLPEFLHIYFLFHPVALDYLIKQAKGAIMAGLNMGIIKELPVLLPSLGQQQSIVDAFQTLKEGTQALERVNQQKLAALDELKQSLLHKAFAGGL